MNEKIKEEYLNNSDNQAFNYVTYKDCENFGNMLHAQNQEMVLFVKTPKGSNLEAGELKNDKKISFHSDSGEIEVFLCKGGEKILKIKGKE